MENNTFKFCPECGSRKIQTLNAGRKWFCPDCGFDLYNNVAAAVGLIIQNEKGEVLFEKRAKNPRKGFLALPGGFLEPDETLENGAMRECMEETGVKPVKVQYLCSFPNTYEYRTVVYKTSDVFFTATLPVSYTLKAEEDEVTGFVWVPMTSVEDVEKAPIAFESCVETMKLFVKAGGGK